MMTRHMRHDPDDFDREFNKMGSFIRGFFVFTAIIIVATLGFYIWGAASIFDIIREAIK